ncbi:MAG: hypothetical protein E6I40_01385 [Chloroflexi bacterium]|nr:MAG: hypothetical protein E6I40_01385 [Chloroflexota bacterium]
MTASGLVVYVIVRVESMSSGSASVTVRGVLRTAEDAEAEVRRLNRSAPSGTSYLWQATTYLARPAGEVVPAPRRTRPTKAARKPVTRAKRRGR